MFIRLIKLVLLTSILFSISCGKEKARSPIEGTKNGWRNNQPVRFSKAGNQDSIENRVSFRLRDNFALSTLPILLTNKGEITLESLETKHDDCAVDPIVEMNLVSVIGDKIQKRQLLVPGGVVAFELMDKAEYGIQFFVFNEGACGEVELEYSLRFTEGK